MTAGWESLGDWLHDQARELGHLVKPRPRPVAVPLLEDMPFTESVPVCDWHHLADDPCWAAAKLRVKIHTGCVDQHWDLMQLCDAHWDRLRDQFEDILATSPPWSCAVCGHPMRHLHDIIPTVVPF